MKVRTIRVLTAAAAALVLESAGAHAQVVVEPAPVYVGPAPYYAPAPVAVAPPPVIVAPA